jgi:hypothetical protein
MNKLFLPVEQNTEYELYFDAHRKNIALPMEPTSLLIGSKENL